MESSVFIVPQFVQKEKSSHAFAVKKDKVSPQKGKHLAGKSIDLPLTTLLASGTAASGRAFSHVHSTFEIGHFVLAGLLETA